MKTLLIVCGLFASYCTGVAAQLADSQITNGNRNGRAWKDMSDLQKVGFVQGYAEGVDAVLKDSRIPADLIKALRLIHGNTNSTVGEVIKGVDQLYSDPANARIPISITIFLFMERVRGISAEDLASRLAAVREIVNK